MYTQGRGGTATVMQKTKIERDKQMNSFHQLQ